MIDKKTVTYIASLSRLHVNESEAEKFAKDLQGILAYVEQLNRVDVKDIKPTSHVLNVENVFRDDVVTPSLSNTQALAFAVDRHKGFYKVPKVIE